MISKNERQQYFRDQCKKLEVNLGSRQFNDQEILQFSSHINQNVEILNLGQSSFTPGSIKYLTVHQWPKLKHLHLVSNRLGNKGVKLLSRASSWTSLLTLGLWRNQIQSEGVLHLAKASWPSIGIIELGNNMIAVDGIFYLLRANWKNIKCIFLQFNRLTQQQIKKLILYAWPILQSVSLYSRFLGRVGDKMKNTFLAKNEEIEWLASFDHQ